MAVKPDRGGLTRSARLSILLNVVVICALGTLLAFAIIWLVGRLSWSHDLRADLTRDARFSIDPMAEQIVRGLREPVHATFVFGIDDEIRRRALDLSGRPREQILALKYRPILLQAASRVQVVLTEWAKLSEKFTVDTVDADQDPQRVKEVAAREGKNAPDLMRGINQVVFEMGSRTRRVPMGRMFSIDWGGYSPDPRGFAVEPQMANVWNVQAELTETLRALAAGESLNVGIPKGIASAIPTDGPDYESIREFLSSQGFELVPFDLQSGVPPSVSLVAFFGMGRRLLPGEGAALKRYEEGGGRLLVLADPRKPEDFGVILDRFGVRLEAAIVEDPVRRDPRQADPRVLFSDELCAGNHEIDRPLVRKIGIWMGRVRPILVENLGSEGAERTTILVGSNAAIAVPVEYREQSGQPEFLTAAKKSAPNPPLAVALKRPVAGGKESRVVVFGSWEIAEPSYLMMGTHYGNRDLFLNALNWIAERRSMIGIVEREIQASRVDLTPAFFGTFKWITWGALNVLLALVAVFVWFVRRN